MMKRLFTAAALTLAATGAALADDTPKDLKTCMDNVFSQAQAAQSNKLSDSKLEEIEGMLTKMEEQCMKKNFSDAAKTGSQISSAIKG